MPSRTHRCRSERGQTISQPFVVALMVQALHLQPGDKVLEDRRRLWLSDRPSVRTDGNRRRWARGNDLRRRASCRAARARRGRARQPGLCAASATSPFDAIIASAVAPHVPRPLWEQLGEGGRMILPLGQHEDDQQLWLVRKLDGQMRVEKLGGVRFVPLISPLFDDPEQWAEE
ncbi:MAG: hypothetical protein IPM07_13195 [Anaerolineales bacterium]|nr:hypothetical protein [Anaerolineales bacterium]